MRLSRDSHNQKYFAINKCMTLTHYLSDSAPKCPIIHKAKKKKKLVATFSVQNMQTQIRLHENEYVMYCWVLMGAEVE